MNRLDGLTIQASASASGVMIPIVAIGASSGGLAPLRHIIAALPSPCSAAIFVVLHTGRHPSVLPRLLNYSPRLPASFPQDGAPIEAGQIYVAPPDHHMTLERGLIRLSQGPKVHHTRPAADPLFMSAARTHGPRVMAIVLSGGDGDGAEGLRIVGEHGGLGLVQDPMEAVEPSMPHAAIMADHTNACLPVAEIAQRVRAFCSR